MAIRKTQPEQVPTKTKPVKAQAVVKPSRTRALRLVQPASFTKGLQGKAPSKGEVSDAAKVVRAQKELLRIAELRLIHQAARSKTSQDVLAALLGTSQPTVSRLSKQIAQDPSILEPSPSEIIYLRAADEIGTVAMMDALVSYGYGAGKYDPTGSDGFIRGSWRQIEDALTAGLITDEEYERIAREAPSAKTARVVR